MLKTTLSIAALSILMLAGPASAQTAPTPGAPPAMPQATVVQAPTGPASPSVSAAPASAAQAAGPPAAGPSSDALQMSSSDDCLKVALDLAQSAETQKLADAEIDRLEDMLVKMETQCAARRYAEAMTLASDIKGLITSR